MRRIPVESLTPTNALGHPLYHESGALLFAAGDRLGDDDVALLVVHQGRLVGLVTAASVDGRLRIDDAARAPGVART